MLNTFRFQLHLFKKYFSPKNFVCLFSFQKLNSLIVKIYEYWIHGQNKFSTYQF